MSKKYHKLLAYLVIPLLALFIIFLRVERFAPIKFKIIDVLSHPIRLISIPFFEVKKILYYHRTFDEYKRLRREVDILRSRLVGVSEIVQENNRLKKLLDMNRNITYSKVVADVIGRDPSNWTTSMIIDKGSLHGIRSGMPVINQLGVVGKISEVGKKTSKVVLVTDPQFSVAVLVDRPREAGLISGTLYGVCRLSYLSPTADIKVGDKVITSKLSTSFPEGLLIGEVTEVHSDPNDPLVFCIVQPVVSPSQVEEVIVVVR